MLMIYSAETFWMLGWGFIYICILLKTAVLAVQSSFLLVFQIGKLGRQLTLPGLNSWKVAEPELESVSLNPKSKRVGRPKCPSFQDAGFSVLKPEMKIGSLCKEDACYP